MFGNDTKNRIEALERSLYGNIHQSREGTKCGFPGLIQRVERAEENICGLYRENEKLKSIVAELCNFVYTDKVDND